MLCKPESEKDLRLHGADDALQIKAVEQGSALYLPQLLSPGLSDHAQQGAHLPFTQNQDPEACWET